MLKWTQIQAALDDEKADQTWLDYPFEEAEEADVEYAVWVRVLERLVDDHGFEKVAKTLYDPYRHREIRDMCASTAHDIIDRYWSKKQGKGGDEQ
jgi:hypothetical protein